jgi:hypothetical protein
MAPVTHPAVIDRPLGRLGNVEVSTYETATGSRLRLRRADRAQAETYLDPLELEGLTRVRYKPIRVLLGASPQIAEDAKRQPAELVERLQNEFAMVGVGVARENGEPGLVITDMNAGLTVLLTARELEALVIARHMDFAPLIDTSDLIAIPEPDIDQA